MHMYIVIYVGLFKHLVLDLCPQELLGEVAGG